MEFCEKCGTRLIQKDSHISVFICPKCGREKTVKAKKYAGPRIPETNESVVVVELDEESLRAMPVIRKECPKCGNNRVYSRAAEVGEEDMTIEVQVFRCTQCGYTWRERE